ncbi:unnamed protein product [Brugia pahangi]|uniref:Uncharacterized protein n=1 Tax=Brugia pahangi TaxID=6280 RepID=A0A0N4TIW4_BRUPA|nr:unnamed protein product [Brugia pahangi]
MESVRNRMQQCINEQRKRKPDLTRISHDTPNKFLIQRSYNDTPFGFSIFHSVVAITTVHGENYRYRL